MWAEAWCVSLFGGCLVGEGESLSPALRREHFKPPVPPSCWLRVSHPASAVHTRHGMDMEVSSPPSAPRGPGHRLAPTSRAQGSRPPHCSMPSPQQDWATCRPRLDVWGTGGFRALGRSRVGGQCQPQRGNRGRASLGAWGHRAGTRSPCDDVVPSVE